MKHIEKYLNYLIQKNIEYFNINDVNIFVIDAIRRNHLNYEVFIPINKTIELLRKAIQLRDKLINENNAK